MGCSSSKTTTAARATAAEDEARSSVRGTSHKKSQSQCEAPTTTGEPLLLVNDNSERSHAAVGRLPPQDVSSNDLRCPSITTPRQAFAPNNNSRMSCRCSPFISPSVVSQTGEPLNVDLASIVSCATFRSGLHDDSTTGSFPPPGTDEAPKLWACTVAKFELAPQSAFDDEVSSPRSMAAILSRGERSAVSLQRMASESAH